jgi:hypothetical protein
MAKTSTGKRSTGRAGATAGRATAKSSSSSKQTRGSTKSAAKPRTAAAKGRGPATTAGKGKVGGNPDAAKRFGGKLDFGTPSKKAHPADQRVKERRDLRPSQRNGPEGRRVVGVGAYGWDPGHSGGAADTDIIGVGTPGGSSVSTDGTLGKRKGKDLTTRGGSAPFASGRRSKNPSPNLVGKVGGDKRVRGGSTASRAEDVTSGGGGTGTGDMTARARDDDQTINPLTGGPARRELGGENA